MSVSNRHIFRQLPVIGALVRTAALTVARQAGLPPKPLTLPSEPLRARVPARDPGLVRDYVRTMGGDTAWYKGALPAHLFPQWSFPLFSKTLANIPYDMTRVLNGGCRLEIHHPLPADKPLNLEARLADIDDDGRRAVMHQELEVGTDDIPHAMTAHMYAIVPLMRDPSAPRTKKAKPHVPETARMLARWKLTPETAWNFAVLTGDFNPIHWVPAAARAAGFKNTILHGFATMALAVEGMNRGLWAGDPGRLATLDVKFVKPLVLPCDAALYVGDDGAFWVGSALGGPAYLVGKTTTHDT